MKTVKTNNKSPKEKVVLVLIDFEGYESIGDPDSESLRWSALDKILFDQDRYQLVILSDHKRTVHHKMNEYQNLVNSEKRHKWINIDSIEYPDVQTLEKKLLIKRNILVKNVMIGGTNTSSNILLNKPWSVVEWIKEGHNVNILLPMCTEYKKPGTTSVEKNINSFADLWNKIKDLGYVDNIQMITDEYRRII